jgi:hypothetical protein
MSWQVLTGVIEWWADEGLRDKGRMRFHRDKGHDLRAGPPEPRGTITFERHAFVARRIPWRLARVSLEEHYPYERDESSCPVVAWADDAVVALSGQPAKPILLGPNETLGDLGLRQMLEPEQLEQLTSRPWPVQMRLDGDVLEPDMLILPAFISLGADHYEATYDPELDVLTSWKAYIDRELAQRTTLTTLTAIKMPTGL